MIQVEALSKRYGTVTAVEQLSFRLAAGQTLVLAGTSGSGKTTTLKMLNRLIEPSSGRILLEGRNILEQPLAEMRRRMGYVIQDIGLFPHFTIAQNIGVVPKLLQWDANRIQQRATELLDRLGLPAEQFLHRYPHELSGGQQQRVGIARALAADPPVILMDEPFGALDPITREQLRQDFQQLEELKEKTTILVTHDVEEAFVLGDLICLLDKGQVQQLGSPQDLLFRPANDFVRQFISSQRLNLAYRSLRLKDVKPHLYKSDAPPAGPVINCDPNWTLAHTQQLLLEHTHPEVSGQTSGPAPVTFRNADLMAACEHILKA